MIPVDDLEGRIQATGRKIEELLDDVRKAAEDAAVTEATFKAEFAKARLKARAEAREKITVDQVEDIATVATENTRLGYLIAANALTVCREALRARQSQMDGLRSLLANHRAAGG